MVILALDTTARVGSCALARDGGVIVEIASNPAESHAQHLPGDLIKVLEQAQLPLDAVDAFAVATGPGSFTGLRVGIATMQGLAFATGKPLIGVSAFDALSQVTRVGFVATWIDAWRGDVYAALYENGREIEGPTVESPAAVLERHHRRGELLFIGDGAGTFAPLIRSTLGRTGRIAEPVSPLLAGIIALLAGDDFRAGKHPGPDAIRPLYVRRTDAELARDARAGQ